MIELHHQIQAAPLSVKLEYVTRDGCELVGTGFGLNHADKIWLVTCRHNLENEPFAGQLDVVAMRVGEECTVVFDPTRRVVGYSVDGYIADCVAIELAADEWGKTPRFSVDQRIDYKGPPPEAMAEIVTPDGTQSIQAATAGSVLVQGYPADAKEPVTYNGTRLPPLPTVKQEWMPSFLPAAEPGFSGGLVLTRTSTAMWLLGVVSHRFDAAFDFWTEARQRASIGLPASACVPIRPLLSAIDLAPAEGGVIPIPAPLNPRSAFLGLAL